jgi:hypothetical protein
LPSKHKVQTPVPPKKKRGRLVKSCIFTQWKLLYIPKDEVALYIVFWHRVERQSIESEEIHSVGAQQNI